MSASVSRRPTASISAGVGARRRAPGDAVAVDVGVDVGVRLAAADGVDQRRRDRVLAVTGGRRHGQVDLPSSVPARLLVVGDVDDAGVDEPVDVAVGGSLSKLEVIHHVLNGRFPLPSEVCVQLSQLWLFEEIGDREEVLDDVAVGAV
jgi:hypothetical protein